MSIRIDIGWLVAALLVSVRVAAATALIPVLGPLRVPGFARVLLAAGLAAALVSAVDVVGEPVTSLTALAVASLSEALVGASLAFGFLIAYAATQVAGRVLDIQFGFGAAGVLNPATETTAPLIGNLLGMAAVAVFLAMDGHHVLIQALAVSLQALPPGTFLRSLDWEALVSHSGALFVFGVLLAAPVMFTLLLVDVAMAVISRSMPQLNVFVLSFAVKIVLGLMVLAASVPVAGSVLQTLFHATFRYWETMASGPSP